MRLERRGRVKRLHSAFNWQQEEACECNKAIDHRQVVDVRSLQSSESQCGNGRGDIRLLRNARIYSCTGNEEWSVSLLDGSGVNREIPAPFCERPEVKFLRPTLLINLEILTDVTQRIQKSRLSLVV